MYSLKRIFIGTLLSAAASVALGQSVQRGQVLEYQGTNPKTPLPRVHIAATNASATQSDADGHFTLQFRTLHAGDAIQFRRIELSGYEVMNSEALEVARVARPQGVSDDEAPLRIIMAPRETLRRLREVYRAVSQQRYEQQLKASEAELERLRQQGQLAEAQYNERMSALEEEYEEKLSQLETYIDKFARIDLGDLDQEEQQVIELVQQGKFEEALQIYEAQHLQERLQQNKADIQQLTSMRNQLDEAARKKAQENLRLRQSIDRQITLLRMAGGEENIRKVHQILQETFLADTTNWEARRELVMSLRAYGEYPSLTALLRNGIASESDPYGRGMLVLDLMQTYWELEQYDESMRQAQLADSILTPIQSSNYVVSSRALAGWSAFMLRYWMRSDNYKDCQPVVDRLRREWAPDTLSTHSLYAYIQVLSDLTDYYSGVGDNQQSLWCAREALRLGEVIERRSPWNSTLCFACASACSTFLLEGLRAEACQAARRCVALLGERLDKSGVKSFYELASTAYFPLIEALVPAGEYALADSIIQSVQARKVLEHIDPSSELNRLHIGIYRFYEAQVLLHNGHAADAESVANQALQTLSETAEGAAFVAFLRPEWEARWALSQQRYADAAKSCQKAIDVCRAIYKESEDAWDADNVCRYYLLLADIHLSAGNKGKVKKALLEADKYAAFESNRQAISALRAKL